MKMLFEKPLLAVFLWALMWVGVSRADFVFGPPVSLGLPVNSSSGEGADCLSTDGLELYFDSTRPGGMGEWDIWVVKRTAADQPWGTPLDLGGPINSDNTDACAALSADGLELYFCSDRPGGHGSWDIWVSKRTGRDAPWGEPENLGTPVNSAGLDGTPCPTPDGLELYLSCKDRPGGYGSYDIWVCRRGKPDDPWGEPVNLGPMVNTTAGECYPRLSADGRVLFFSDESQSEAPSRPGGLGKGDIWMTMRVDLSGTWGRPVNPGPVINTSMFDSGPVLSPDGRTLYFCSERRGGLGGPYGDIYQAVILPIVDFNADAKVDLVDLVTLIDHWGTDKTLCDIGPMPWGDGKVDIEDLEVFMTEWEKENRPTQP